MGRDEREVRYRVAMARRLAALTVLLTLAACEGPSGLSTDAGASDAEAPDAGGLPDDGWAVGAPEDHGMDPAALEALREYTFAEGRNTQGVVVVRHGVIVAEWYAPSRDAASYAASWSIGKSVASALIGIAIDEGLIDGVDVPLTDYYPSWAGTEREQITLRHVLQQATGLQWDETYDVESRDTSDIIQLVLLETPQLDYVLERPQAVEADTTFNYSSGNSLLLSGILEQATGAPADEYAQARLFEPLGIEGAQWWRDTAGTTLTYCCVDMRTRDFARFGQLFLDRGAHEGEQIVPEAWIDESLSPSPAFDGYGYQWWLDGNRDASLPADAFAAHGHDGQHILVVPSLDLVVVRNGIYDKYRGEPIADPSLFARYPSSGLVPNRGTLGAEGWSSEELLRLAVAAIVE